MLILLKKDVIILGDFNIDFLDKTNNGSKRTNRVITDYGLIKLINSLHLSNYYKFQSYTGSRCG